MSNLSLNFRQQLKEIPIHPLKIINENISKTKKTQKYLFQLSSGKLIESVLMKEGKRVTAVTRLPSFINTDSINFPLLNWNKYFCVFFVFDIFSLIILRG